MALADLNGRVRGTRPGGNYTYGDSLLSDPLGRLVRGTAGPRAFTRDFDAGSEQIGAVPETFTRNGITYNRSFSASGDPTDYIRRNFPQYLDSNQFTYDPEFGYGAGPELSELIKQKTVASRGFWDSPAPFFLAAGGVGGVTAPATGLFGEAAGGAEAGLGEGIGADAYFVGANAPIAETAAAGAGLTEAQALKLAGSEMTPAELAAAPGGVPEIQFSGPPQIPQSPGGGGPGGGTALSRIIDGTASNADWVQILGTAGATGLGVYAGGRRSDRLSDLQRQLREDRAPFLNAATGYLQDPASFTTGPGQAAMKGTLAGLSAKFGNPIGSAAALQISNEAAMKNWLNAVGGLGSLGLGGQGVQANLGAGAAQADFDRFGTLAGGISDIVNPRPSLADLLREFKRAGLSLA